MNVELIRFIHVEPTTFEISNSGVITGRVSICVNDEYFPEKEWNDSVVAILNWWAVGFESFFRAEVNSVNLHFMEGPLRVCLERNGAISYITFFNNSTQVNKFIVDSENLKTIAMKDLTQAANASLGKCNKERWLNKDTEQLSEAVSKLKRVAI